VAGSGRLAALPAPVPVLGFWLVKAPPGLLKLRLPLEKPPGTAEL